MEECFVAAVAIAAVVVFGENIGDLKCNTLF